MKTVTTFAALLTLLSAVHPTADAALRTVALSGNAAPGTSDKFAGFFGTPALNNAGQTAFIGVLSGSAAGFAIGIWSEGGGSGLALVAPERNTAPGTSDNFTALGLPVLNNAGQTAFRGFLNSSSGTNSGIWSEGGGSGLALVVRLGSTAPGTSNNFTVFANPVLNDTGQAAFHGYLNSSTGTNRGIWSEGGGSGLVLVAREGNSAPGTSDNFTALGLPVLNNAGQTAFSGFLNSSSGTNSAIWSEGGGNGLALVARKGNIAPGTNDSFAGFDHIALNNAGQTAFAGRLDWRGATDRGIWAEDLLGVLTLIAREGDLLDVDDGPGTDLRRISSLDFVAGTGNGDERASGFNDLGQLAFFAKFTDGTSGIFISDLVAVPEPTSVVLGALGLFGLLASRRREK